MHGFRQGASGLLLPVEASRTRRTLTWPEWRTLEAATRILSDERMKAETIMRCSDPHCPDRKLERVRVGHGMALRCGCTDRVFEKAL